MTHSLGGGTWHALSGHMVWSGQGMGREQAAGLGAHAFVRICG